MALTQIKSSNITDGTIVNADVSASAAIASTKLSGVESGLTSVQTFTSSGTWTRPTNITKVIVEVQGGGGGGGYSGAASYMIAGSSGGYAKKFLDVSSIASSTITIGAGGAGATTSVAGSDGGDSSWADGTNTITGSKGVGAYSSYGTAVGGSATGGDINIKGQNGRNNSTGAGGDSQLGTGGWSGYSGEQAPEDGSGYGAGGGAGYNVNAGAGSAGIILVWEYK